MHMNPPLRVTEADSTPERIVSDQDTEAFPIGKVHHVTNTGLRETLAPLMRAL